jgi:hypothetical protein
MSCMLRAAGVSFDVDAFIAFLERHAEEVRRLVAFPGAEGVELDFGIARRNVAAQSDWFPPRLVSLAGSLCLGLTISHYAISAPD